MPNEWFHYQHNNANTLPNGETVIHIGGVNGAPTTQGQTRDTIFARPHLTGPGGQLTGVSIDMAVNSELAIKMAIYRKLSNSIPLPGALLIDVGCNAFIATNVTTLTASASLPANDLVWVCINANSNAGTTCTALEATNAIEITGNPATLAGPQPFVTQSYGFASAWPATFPITNPTLSSADCPTFALRING